MDVETLRLEREEKRRQRRERIRRILEDDTHTPTRRTREERETTTTRSTPTTRRAREHVTTTTSERRHIAEESSVRSTRTSRLRENATYTPSSRGHTNIIEDSSTRSTAMRRPREDRTTTSERTYAGSRNIAGGSPTRRTAQNSRLATETTAESTGVDSIRARRDARRRRNQEHDYRQNKITVETGEVDNAMNLGDHSRLAKDRKSTEDKDLQEDRQDESESSKEGEGDHSRITRNRQGSENKDLHEDKQEGSEGSKEHGLSKETEDSKDITGDSDVMIEDNLGKIGLSSEETNDELVTKDRDEPGESSAVSEIKLTEIEKLDEHAIEARNVSDKADVVVEIKVSQEDEKDTELESGEIDNSQRVDLLVAVDQKQDEVSAEKVTNEVNEVKHDCEDKKNDDKVDKQDKKVEDSCDTRTHKVQASDSGDKLEITVISDGITVISDEITVISDEITVISDEITVITDQIPKAIEESEITDITTPVEEIKISDMPAFEEPELEEKAIEPLLETSPSQPIATEDSSSEEISASADGGKLAADQELVILDELPNMLVLENEINESTTRTDGKPSEDESTEDSQKIISEEVDTYSESVVDGMPQDLANETEDISQKVTEGKKIASPNASPKKSKLSTKVGDVDTKLTEADTKCSKSRTKSNVSRTKSDESEAKNDRLGTKSDITRTKNAESGTKTNESGPKASLVGKLKVSDDSWKKNVRKKRGVPDVDRAVELTVLGRTGKMKDKLKSCETRDVDSADQWKREVKKGPRKHKSLDEETEKELRQLPSKFELKGIIKSCEEKDQESADAWKREVKKNVRKHKSLDEDTENELREISQANILRSRIKECEEKDKKSAEAWKKEVKKEGRPKDSDAKAEVSEDLKEFSGSGRLKDLISSCAERDEKRDESWESAKEQQKLKAADEQAELQELASLSEAKSKIIQQCEERDKESSEAGKKKIKSSEGAKSFDETTDEELKELAKTVDVKTRIQLRIEDQEKPKEVVKRSDHLEDEELKEIDLKVRLEAFKQESEQHVTEDKGKKSPSKAKKTESGRTSPSKADISGRKSPNKDIAQHGRTSPSKGDNGRISPAKDRPRSSSSTSGRVSPRKDRSRTSSTIGDTSGRVSPTKDRSRSSSTKGDNGRTSPSKDVTQPGRTSPTKKDTSAGRISPNKDGKSATKQDTKGRVSPTKDASTPAKSKLESIRANLYDGSKAKTKSKRESLHRVAKTSNIKDKIAACKERDKMAPRTITLPKSPAKAKPKPEPEKNTLNAGNENTEANKIAENGERVPVNRMGEHFTTVEEEIQGASIKGALSFWKEPVTENKSEVPEDEENEVVDVDIKEKMTYWESSKRDEDMTPGRDSPSRDSERPVPVVISNIKPGWQKRKRKLNAAEFIKQLLSSDCKRRELKDIEDVKSETKKYLVGGMHAEEAEKTSEDHDEVSVRKNVQLENRKNSKKSVVGASDEKVDDEFSLDDLVNPGEVKQLRDFSNFRRQVRPTNRRAAKSNPVRKLQQREDLKTGTESFNDEIDDEDEEDAPLKPTAIGRLGRAIEPGDRNSRDINKFAADALAGLAAKEDASKVTLKKTSKSKSGVSQEKSEHDGTAPVMLLQIKGHRHMQTRLVEPSVNSLNSADSFILITEKYLHVWNGKDANVMKKSKATELSNKILQYKLLNCTATVVTIIKDGSVNVETGLTRTFWNTLGGRKTVKGSKDSPKDGDYEKAVVSCNVVYAVDTNTEPAKLKKIPELSGKIPKIDMLDSDKAFVFDFGSEVYAWLGRTCDKTTRSQAVNLAREVHNSSFEVHNSLNPITPNMPKDDDKSRQLKRPSWALFGRMTERAETILFEQKFLDWPDVATKMKIDKEKDLLNKNLSKGYAKRMAKIEKSEYQAIELVPYDGARMGEELPPVKLILEGVNVGRGRGSYDEIERRGLSVITNSVTVYHSSDKESRQLEEKEWGHFYSAESYVIRWSYSVKASGIRSLKGGESKRDTTGRDQIAYFFWHGRDCSASGKGTSALATIELDSDKSPQIMVDEGHESACFLNMFDGQMVVHHGKPDEAKSIEEDNVLMYCVHHEDEREICLTQIEARSSNLRSRSSFVVVVIDQVIGICVWHGAKSTKEKKEGALRGAKRLATWFQGIFDVNKVDMVELEEGHEGNLFWESLDGKEDYGSLKNVSSKCDNRVRLFTFLSTEGPFLAREILNPTRGEHVSPYPFRQANLYDATQPALFLVDAVHVMYLWQGWWPGNLEESESATTTGSAEFRWHRDRKLAMQSIQSYADTVGRQMSKAYVVNAGLEPVEFRALFPFWEDHPDVTKINLESGKVNSKKESMTELLAKLSRDRYTLAELLVRPLPEGVDPLKMEMYLSDEEFQEVFKMTKEEFTKLPKWKKLEQRKKVGLF